MHQLKHSTERQSAKSTVNLAAGLSSPIPFADDTKRSVTQLSKQAQIFLINQASQTVIDIVPVWCGFH